MLTADNEAIRYFARRDLAGEAVPPVETLWQLSTVMAILKRQAPSGAWPYLGGKAELRGQEDYDQIETFRMMRYLIEKYGLDRRHPATCYLPPAFSSFSVNLVHVTCFEILLAK